MTKVVLQIAMRLHKYLNNTGADAGQIFCKRLRVWHRQTRASCRSSFDSRGPFPCIFFMLGRLLQLGHVGSCCCLAGHARTCTAAECPARSRTRARSAPPRGKQLQPRRERRTPAGRLAARRRLPAASMPPPPRRAEPAAAGLPWRPRLSLRYLPLPAIPPGIKRASLACIPASPGSCRGRGPKRPVPVHNVQKSISPKVQKTSTRPKVHNVQKPGRDPLLMGSVRPPGAPPTRPSAPSPVPESRHTQRPTAGSPTASSHISRSPDFVAGGEEPVIRPRCRSSEPAGGR